MEAAIDQISISLKEIQMHLSNLSKVKTNNMFSGLHTQITAMGEQLEKLVKNLKTAQGIN